MTRTLALLAALAITAGCAPHTQAVMNPWIGKTDMQLMAAWGAPDLESTSDGMGRHLTWVHRTDDGRPICKRSFTVIDHRVEEASSSCAW